MASTIIYEVSCVVSPEVAEPFAAWLRHHVPEVAALPGFLEGRWGEVVGGSRDGARTFVCWYRLADAAAMERYLADDAPRMRADGLRRFGERYTATRRVIAERS